MNINVLSIAGTVCINLQNAYLTEFSKVNVLHLTSALSKKAIVDYPYACFLRGNTRVDKNINLGFSDEEYKLFIQSLGLSITFYDKKPVSELKDLKSHIHKDLDKDYIFKGFIIKGTIDTSIAMKAAALFSLYNNSPDNLIVRSQTDTAVRFKTCDAGKGYTAVGYKDFHNEGDTLSRETPIMKIVPNKQLKNYMNKVNTNCIKERVTLYEQRDLSLDGTNNGLLVFPVSIIQSDPQETLTKLGLFALNNCRGISRKRSFIFNPSNASIMVPRWTLTNKVKFALNVVNCDIQEILSSLKLLRILCTNFNLLIGDTEPYVLKIPLKFISSLDSLTLKERIYKCLIPSTFSVYLDTFDPVINVTKKHCYNLTISGSNILLFEEVIEKILEVIEEG